MSSTLQETILASDSRPRTYVPSREERIELTMPSEKLLPSIVQAPDIELKQLPSHLKYAFLGENDTLPVIISNKLTFE